MEVKILGNLALPVRQEIFKHLAPRLAKQEQKRTTKAIESYPDTDTKYIKPGTNLDYNPTEIDILARNTMISTKKIRKTTKKPNKKA